MKLYPSYLSGVWQKQANNKQKQERKIPTPLKWLKQFDLCTYMEDPGWHPAPSQPGPRHDPPEGRCHFVSISLS